MTFVSDTDDSNAIPRWGMKVGKAVCEDETLSSYFVKSSKDAGFCLDESEKYIIGAKLRYIGNSSQVVNQEMENGDIAVSAGRKQSYSEMEKIMKNNISENVWISVIGIPCEGPGKYIFKGYYKYVKKHDHKYLIRPVDNFTEDSSKSSEEEDDNDIVVQKRKYVKRNNIVTDEDERLCNNSSENFLQPNDFSAKTSLRPFYNGFRYDSMTEARYAVLFNYFQIPFTCQPETGVLNSQQNHSKYVIDYEVFPNDPSKRFYIEVKPFRPSLHEEQLCEQVAYITGVPVYILYGNFDVPFSTGKDFPNGYSSICYKLKNGNMSREEGYVFTERNGEICMDTRKSVSDFGFYSCKLKSAYEHVKTFRFSY